MIVYDAVISDRMLLKGLRGYIIDRRYSFIYGYMLSLLQITKCLVCLTPGDDDLNRPTFHKRSEIVH